MKIILIVNMSPDLVFHPEHVMFAIFLADRKFYNTMTTKPMYDMEMSPINVNTFNVRCFIYGCNTFRLFVFPLKLDDVAIYLF